jgi:hypothetical protein
MKGSVRLPRPNLAPSFWRLQAVGWLCYVTAITLTTVAFWRDRENFVYRASFVFAAFAISFPLRYVCRKLWRSKVAWPQAMAIAFVTSYLLGLGCSMLATLALANFGSDHPMRFEWSEAFAGSISGCFLLAIWSALYFGVKHYGALEEERHKALVAEASAREAQLRALRYQMHPHFLFNTLNALSTLVHEGRNQAATRMIARLGDFLRATLEGNGQHQVPLADEIFLTEQYLEIEKIRLGERLSLKMNIEPSTLDAMVPHLLLQPLVENAIRHGIAKRREGGHLTISTGREGDDLTIEVCDNGPGKEDCEKAPGEKSESGSGIGLDNLRSRLFQLYGVDQQVDLYFPRGGGCRVKIRLPFQRQPAAPSIARGIA